MEKKRVILIATKAAREGAGKGFFVGGGAQKYIKQLETTLGGKGEWEIEVKRPKWLGNESGFLFWKDGAALLEMWRIFRREQPAIVHLNSSKAGVIGALAAKLAGVPRVIFTAHGWVFADQDLSWVRRVGYRWFSRLASLGLDAIITVSEFDRQLALDYKVASRRKLTTIWNGLDIGYFKKRFLERGAARDFLKAAARQRGLGELDEQAIWIGSVGRLVKEKNYTLLLKAIKELGRRGESKTIQWLIIGEGEEREKLEREIKEAGLEEKVWLMGEVGNAAYLLKALDLFVLPSRKEGLPYTLIEAMAAGVPVITSRVGGMTEVIGEEERGWLFGAREGRELADKIERIFREGEEKERRRQAAEKFAAERLTEKRMAAETEKVYRAEEKQRVAVLTTAYWPFLGGAEVAIKEITDRLNGFDVAIVTARLKGYLPRRERVGRADVYRIGWGGYLDKYWLIIAGPLKIWRLERSSGRKPPVIWGIMASYGGAAAMILKTLKPDWPFLLTLQEGDSEGQIRKRVGIFYPWWRQIFRRADKVQAISNYLKNFALRHGAEREIEVVPNGVNLEKFQIKNGKSQTDLKSRAIKLKERLGIGEDEKVVVTVSRLVEKNGVDVLIRAMSQVSAKLVIVGEGEQRKELERLVEAEGLKGRVVFVGEVPNQAVPNYYAMAEVFCRLARSEGFGNVFIEAMAVGVPVVATTAGGIKDFLRDGENGLAVKINDPIEAAQKIKMVLEDQELAARMRQEGRRTAEKYDWSGVANKMERILREMTAGKMALVMAAPIWPPQAGGPATYARAAAAELRRRGIGVRVVAYGKESSEGAITVSRRWPRGIRQVVYAGKLLRQAAGAELIYALDAAAAGGPAAVVATITGKRLVVRVGGDLLWERAAERGTWQENMEKFYGSGAWRWFRPGLRLVIGLVLRRAELVVVPAPALKQICERYYGARRVEIIKNVWENGGDQEKETDRGASAFKIIFAGRLVRYKNLERLIEAIRVVIDRGEEAELLIVGEGPSQSEITAKIESLGLAGRVKMKPTLPAGEVKRLIREADLGMAVAWTEFNPNFILECLAAGKPVILSRSHGLSVKLPADWLVDPMNTSEIADKIIQAKKDYQSRRRQIRELKINFSYKESVDELLEFL